MGNYNMAKINLNNYLLIQWSWITWNITLRTLKRSKFVKLLSDII